jgi:uncharacterized protein YndB with AHSA1/START domain
VRVAEIDRGFVRVASDRVFEVVSKPDRYPEWWPGIRAEDQGRIRFPEMGVVHASTDRVKPGVELLVRVRSDAVRGHLQWYLERFRDGTIVYGITDIETKKPWSPRRVLRHRASIHRALIALKETLE